MMHCPKCQTAAHTKSSRYVSKETKETKERYHQCQNINCSCTFKTLESVSGIIVEPAQINTVPMMAKGSNNPSPQLL